MGLDMYLTQKHYVGNKYRKESERIRLSYPESQADATFTPSLFFLV